MGSKILIHIKHVFTRLTMPGRLRYSRTWVPRLEWRKNWIWHWRSLTYRALSTSQDKLGIFRNYVCVPNPHTPLLTSQHSMGGCYKAESWALGHRDNIFISGYCPYKSFPRGLPCTFHWSTGRQWLSTNQEASSLKLSVPAFWAVRNVYVQKLTSTAFHQYSPG